MILELTKQEVDAIIYVLGQLPTAQGSWPLWQKIKKQVEEDASSSEG